MAPLTTALLSVRALTDADSIGEISEAWDALVEEMPRPSPYLLSAWVRAWLDEPSFGSRPHVLVAERGGDLVGVAPFVIRSHGRASIAEFAGAHESALADILLGAGRAARDGPHTARRAAGLGRGRARRIRVARRQRAGGRRRLRTCA